LLQAKAKVAFDSLVTVWSNAFFRWVLGRNLWSFAVICCHLVFAFAFADASYELLAATVGFWLVAFAQKLGASS
jgi:hypothetical protein